MRKGRALAARLAAIAALESWAATAECGAVAPLRLSGHQRRALGADCAALNTAISACRRQRHALAPVVRCLARVMRERCQS
jgi:hypothetical protein